MKRRVADIIMDCLIERGIVDCFAVTGGGAMFIDNALYHCHKMTKYFNHHEQACAMAAEAYARATGKLALVSVTSGPGGTNTLTGVMGAYVDSLPLIVISGQVRYEVSVPKSGLKLRTRAIQEFNIVDTVKTMTKYSKLVTNPYDIKMEINKAIDISLSGRMGPVWLDIPQDVQSAVIDTEKLTENVVVKNDEYSVNLEDIFDELSRSNRPVLLAGAGVSVTNSSELLYKVAEKYHLPIISSFNATDVTYQDGDLSFGSIGPCGQRSSNIIIQNSDLIISLGCSLGFSTTGFAQEEFAKHSKIISVDIDEEEQKKPGIKIYKKIKCDLRFFLKSLYYKPHFLEKKVEWLDYCNRIKTMFSPYAGAEGKNGHDRVCSYIFWKHFFDMANNDALLVLGNNTAITSVIQTGKRKKNQHIYANFNCGSMGYDLPAAIGVAVAKNETVFLATGDGSIMMNLQELQTIHHYKLPIKIILFENQGYNAIRQTSKNFFNGELIGCTPETGVSFPSFKDVFKTFGFSYLVCESNSDVKKCLEEFFASDNMTVLEVREFLDDPVIPKVMSRTDVDGKLLSPALHDMYPFLDKEELKNLMISEYKFYD